MAKLNQIEVNGTTYDLQDKSIFTGTQSEVNSAISNGTIKEGDIVNITDDVSGNGGGGPVLDTIEEIMANTTSGIGAGALAVKEGFNQVNESLENIKMFPDYTNVLYEFNAQGQSWTATENCVLIGSVSQINGTLNGARIFVNSIGVAGNYNDSAYYLETTVFVMVKKGQTISTRSDGGKYSVKAYGLQ